MHSAFPHQKPNLINSHCVGITVTKTQAREPQTSLKNVKMKYIDWTAMPKGSKEQWEKEPPVVNNGPAVSFRDKKEPGSVVAMS